LFLTLTPLGTEVHAGAKLKFIGNLDLGGNAYVWPQAQPSAGSYDKITTGPIGNYDVTLDGNSL